MQVSVHEAKTQLSWLIEAALKGEEVVIARGSTPVVRLTPITRSGFKLGMLDGLVGEVPDFLEPMDEEDLRLWEGRNEVSPAGLQDEEARQPQKDTARRAAKKAINDERARRAANAKPGTLGYLANKLLMEVIDEKHGVKWGHSYRDVYEKLKREFPNNEPTLNTLRWYESKLRAYHGKDAVPHHVNDLA